MSKSTYSFKKTLHFVFFFASYKLFCLLERKIQFPLKWESTFVRVCLLYKSNEVFLVISRVSLKIQDLLRIYPGVR